MAAWPRLLLCMALSTAAAASATPAAAKPLTALTPAPAPRLDRTCDDADLPSLAAAIEREAAALAAPGAAPLAFARRRVPAVAYVTRTLLPLAALARAGDRARLCAALARRYRWYRVGDAPVWFTAYHTPTVRGSLTRDATYRWPLYRRPPAPADAALTTAAILAGALADRGLELVWLADAYDALALHVEGAGNVRLPDGRLFPVGFGGHNGLPYHNVSRMLLDDGKVARGPLAPSAQPGNPRARAYFAAHPEELDAYWGRNAHFVFFRAATDAGGGHFGALVAGRSVAVDAARVPLGALVWARTERPRVEAGRVVGTEPLARLWLAQDTGSAIRGQRMDLFFGDDDYAQTAAQTLSGHGPAWVLLAR